MSKKNRITFTYHEKYKITKCFCGKTLNAKHGICNSSGNIIEVKNCIGIQNGCTICEKKNRKKKFWEQWDYNRDGYLVCYYCQEKLTGDADEPGKLPKECDCIFFVDFDGKKKCNNCNKVIYEECNGFCSNN